MLMLLRPLVSIPGLLLSHSPLGRYPLPAKRVPQNFSEFIGGEVTIMFPGQVGAQAVLRFSTRPNNIGGKVMKLRSACRVNFFHLLVDYAKTSVFSLDVNYYVIRRNVPTFSVNTYTET